MIRYVIQDSRFRGFGGSRPYKVWKTLRDLDVRLCGFCWSRAVVASLQASGLRPFLCLKPKAITPSLKTKLYTFNPKDSEIPES